MFGTAAGSGIVRVLMSAEIKNSIVLVKQMLGAITVVDIEIDINTFLYPAFCAYRAPIATLLKIQNPIAWSASA